jgi:hypothetical protein
MIIVPLIKRATESEIPISPPTLRRQVGAGNVGREKGGFKKENG